MGAFLHWLAIFAFVAGHLDATTDFCKLKCGKDHTVCKRQPCYQNSKCGKKYKMLLPNDEVRQWILDIHNELRDQISSNASNVFSGNTGAKNMAVLSYNKELEFVAQCWANACGHEGGHDSCRSTSRFGYVGQNVWSSWTSGKSYNVNYDTFRSAIRSWFNERKKATIGDIKCFLCKKTKGGIGHFTQVAWAKTTHVGCGVTKYGGEKGTNVILVCNYGNGGNMVRSAVYEEGKPPCSKCKNNAKCNAKYPTLCGEIESFAMDTWTAPFALGGEKIAGSAMVVCLLVVVASSSTIFHL